MPVCFGTRLGSCNGWGNIKEEDSPKVCQMPELDLLFGVVWLSSDILSLTERQKSPETDPKRTEMDRTRGGGIEGVYRDGGGGL